MSHEKKQILSEKMKISEEIRQLFFVPRWVRDMTDTISSFIGNCVVRERSQRNDNKDANGFGLYHVLGLF